MSNAFFFSFSLQDVPFFSYQKQLSNKISSLFLRWSRYLIPLSATHTLWCSIDFEAAAVFLLQLSLFPIKNCKNGHSSLFILRMKWMFPPYIADPAACLPACQCIHYSLGSCLCFFLHSNFVPLSPLDVRSVPLTKGLFISAPSLSLADTSNNNAFSPSKKESEELYCSRCRFHWFFLSLCSALCFSLPPTLSYFFLSVAYLAHSFASNAQELNWILPSPLSFLLLCIIFTFMTREKKRERERLTC